MFFTSPGRSVLEETVPSVWVPPGTDLEYSFSQYGPPSRWITYISSFYNTLSETEDDYVEVPILLQKTSNLQPRLNALIIDRFFRKFVL